jgi:hypothetical protein
VDSKFRELETLSTLIVPGQEPSTLADSAFDVTLPSAVEDYDLAGSDREPPDDRAVRDAFLRLPLRCPRRIRKVSVVQIFVMEMNGLTPRAFLHRCHMRRRPT